MFESGNRVSTLTVIVVCKNSQEYLKRFNKVMEAIEARSGLQIAYIFVENGSNDTTRSIIDDFLNHREGLLVSRGNNELLNLIDRPKRLGYLRNLATLYLGEFQAPWTLLVDTDVYFNADALESLFSKNPTQNNVGMLCAFGMEALPLDAAKTDWATTYHYYDTAAFVADDGSEIFPHCMFEGCLKCAPPANARRLPSTGLVKVKSAFGGMALVRTELLGNRAIRWKAAPCGPGAPECEHIGFCESLTRESGLAVAIDCDTKILWDAETLGK